MTLSLRRLSLFAIVVLGLGLAFAHNTALASTPYVNVSPVSGNIILGPTILGPDIAFGKEYSHDLDHRIEVVGVSLSPEQVVAWDGSGGVMNGQSFTGTRPNFDRPSQFDAIANHLDALFFNLKRDEAHLVYSIDNAATAFIPDPIAGGGFHVSVTIPAGGLIAVPDAIKGGFNLIGGAGEISYELATQFAASGNAANTHGRWATLDQINNFTNPVDIDGIEIWGPEPGETADTNKYSLDTDYLSFGLAAPGDAVSVWNLSGTPYVLHSRIVEAVTSLLGPLPDRLDVSAINLDALMVREVVNDQDLFERSDSQVDEIIFSIRQISDPFAADGSGYYATGSELFVLEAPFATGAPGLASFLEHGGHFWDKRYALENMITVMDVIIGDEIIFDAVVQLDVNAIEAVAENFVVPEPSTAALGLLAIATLLGWRWRRGARSF